MLKQQAVYGAVTSVAIKNRARKWLIVTVTLVSARFEVLLDGFSSTKEHCPVSAELESEATT